jgi:hypothetical protein
LRRGFQGLPQLYKKAGFRYFSYHGPFPDPFPLLDRRRPRNDPKTIVSAGSFAQRPLRQLRPNMTRKDLEENPDKSHSFCFT